jgi:chemotaxis protein CheD
MVQTIEVGMADFAVAKGRFILESKGIGSCVVTCLYDSAQKIGALCHVMLPTHPGNLDLNLRRFADTALPLVFEELEHMGSGHEHLVAHIIGGASMFSHPDPFISTIGEQNLMAVRDILTKQAVSIKSTAVGGNKGRSVTFFLDSGEVIVTSKM